MQASTNFISESSYGSTSVDAICHRAGVNKGSFYHFFASKEELAGRRSRRIGSTSGQSSMSFFPHWFRPWIASAGCTRFVSSSRSACSKRGDSLLDVPCSVWVASLHQNEPIRRKVEEILGEHFKFIELAIRDADAQHLIHAPDATAKARILIGYIEGQLPGRGSKTILLDPANRGRYAGHPRRGKRPGGSGLAAVPFSHCPASDAQSSNVFVTNRSTISPCFSFHPSGAVRWPGHRAQQLQQPPARPLEPLRPRP